jgi:mannose/cellobiose epimerase-like protein (N-acyl-D-glucosamine 2-epimerase family)
MRSFTNAGWILGALLIAQTGVASAASWNDEALWAGAVGQNLEFFDRHAWDEASGSYASDLDVAGKRTSENRYPVALGRMVYANAKAPGALRNLKRARASADFLIRNMIGRDQHGVFFKSSVDAQGKEVPSGRSYFFSFEQSYPIAGLIALYEEDRAGNADLLPLIREAARSYWSRFHDPVSGGLFYYSNFAKQDHSNDSGETHKSYQSTVYPVSSFLLALREVDAENRALYDSWIREALGTALDHLVEVSGGARTGWLRERFAADWAVDEGYKMTEAGHITQLAWVLGVAAERGIVSGAEKARYLSTAKDLLLLLLKNGGISPSGAVHDAFDRTTGMAWTGSDGRATSAWWSTLEAIIGFDFARKRGWIEDTSVLDSLSGAYFDHFVDRVAGGEFFRIDSETGAVIDGTKGGPGKSGYHLMEAYEYLFAHQP